MANILVHTADESVTLTAQAAARLLDRGDGDAALLYLALQRFGRGVTPEELERVLPTMSRLRMDAAEGVLQELESYQSGVIDLTFTEEKAARFQPFH